MRKLAAMQKQVYLFGDPALVQVVTATDRKSASCRWSHGLAGVVLGDSLFDDWRLWLVVGDDMYGDTVSRLVGRWSVGLNSPQFLKRTAVACENYSLECSVLQCSAGWLYPPEETSWSEFRWPDVLPDQLVLMSSHLGVAKLGQAYHFLQRGGQDVVLVASQIETDAFVQAAPHLRQNVLWVLPEQTASRLMHAVTQHPGFIGSGNPLERAELAARTLATYGCRAVVIAGGAGAAMADGSAAYVAVPRPTAFPLPWRPYVDFYLQAAHLALQGANFSCPATQLHHFYQSVSNSLEHRRQSWTLSVTQSLL